MATANGPDLTDARLAVEALMDDTCTVSRPGAEAGETLHPTTLALIPPAPTVVYTGPCSVRSNQGLIADERVEASRPITETKYMASLPVYLAPEILVGDELTVTSSRRDPLLAGKVFIVTSSTVKTFAISRKVQLRLR